MVDLKTVVVSVVAVLSGIRAQPTISSSSVDDSCSQLEGELGFQVDENMRLQSLLESDRQKIEVSERLQAEENHQLNIELENKQQKIDTLGNVSNITAEEIHRLNLELEYKQRKIEALENERRRLRTLGIQSATATFIHTLAGEKSFQGITKVEDRIFITADYPSTITVFEDGNDFRFISETALDTIINFCDIVYSNKSKCVYIIDAHYLDYYVWMMTTTGEHRMTLLLTNVKWTETLSLSNEGHLLVLRQGQPFNQLEIYSLNASLIRRLNLPQDMEKPLHVVQTSVGNFIILHQLNNVSSQQWVISLLTNAALLINRFIPRNKSEELDYPQHLSLDSDNNRLFVADRFNHRVILFDSTDLTWSQVLLTQEINGIRHPFRLFYDANKKHLFVIQYGGNVTVYEVN